MSTDQVPCLSHLTVFRFSLPPPLPAPPPPNNWAILVQAVIKAKPSLRLNDQKGYK